MHDGRGRRQRRQGRQGESLRSDGRDAVALGGADAVACRVGGRFVGRVDGGGGRVGGHGGGGCIGGGGGGKGRGRSKGEALLVVMGDDGLHLGEGDG